MGISIRDEMNGAAALFIGEGPELENTKWDGRSHDPGLEMFKAAYHLACLMGLTPDQMPELRTENGVLHAYRTNGTKIRLAPYAGWEEESGYADLLRELRHRKNDQC